MRQGKTGTWWVLQQKGMPLYFDGSLVEFAGRKVAVFVMDKAKAQQSADRGGAVMLASIFGIGDQVEPVELEFAA